MNINKFFDFLLHIMNYEYTYSLKFNIKLMYKYLSYFLQDFKNEKIVDLDYIKYIKKGYKLIWIYLKQKDRNRFKKLFSTINTLTK
jgi:hypothetical protein